MKQRSVFDDAQAAVGQPLCARQRVRGALVLNSGTEELLIALAQGKAIAAFGAFVGVSFLAYIRVAPDPNFE